MSASTSRRLLKVAGQQQRVVESRNMDAYVKHAALQSVQSLERVIGELTLSETTALIQFEQRSLRRKSIIKRLQRHSRKLAVQQINVLTNTL